MNSPKPLNSRTAKAKTAAFTLAAAVALLGASLGIGAVPAGAAIENHQKGHHPSMMTRKKLPGRMHGKQMDMTFQKNEREHDKSMWIQKGQKNHGKGHRPASEVRRRKGGVPSSRMEKEGGGSPKHGLVTNE